MKALGPQTTPGRAGPLPGDVAAQADIDRDTKGGACPIGGWAAG